MPSSVRILIRVPFTSKATARMSMLCCHADGALFIATRARRRWWCAIGMSSQPSVKGQLSARPGIQRSPVCSTTPLSGPERSGGGSKQLLGLRHEPSAIAPADVVVPRDPQQVQRHIVRRPRGNRLEGSLAIREMTAVLPEKMANERLRTMPVADCTHERMLELARDPADIEHPVPALHAFQIDRRAVQARTEEKIRRSRVTVQPDLLVLPHLRSVPPAVAQP